MTAAIDRLHCPNTRGSMDKETTKAVLKRLERKAEILRLDFKAAGHPRKYDMDEMLSLIWALQGEADQ